MHAPELPLTYDLPGWLRYIERPRPLIEKDSCFVLASPIKGRKEGKNKTMNKSMVYKIKSYYDGNA
jgi:hypothetical protein